MRVYTLQCSDYTGTTAQQSGIVTLFENPNIMNTGTRFHTITCLHLLSAENDKFSSFTRSYFGCVICGMLLAVRTLCP